MKEMMSRTDILKYKDFIGPFESIKTLRISGPRKSDA
jgi:hypothetical protein